MDLEENQELREAMAAMIAEMDQLRAQNQEQSAELGQLRAQNQEQSAELARQRREIYELGRDKDVLYFDLQNWKPAEPEPKRKCVMSID